MIEQQQDQQSDSRRSSISVAIAVFSLGLILSVFGFFAVRWYESNSAGETVRKATGLLQANHPVAAREALAWLLWAVPDHSEALLLQGKCLLVEGNLQAAINNFQRVSSDAGTPYLASRYPLANALVQDGQLDEAESVLAAYRQVDPGSKDALYQLWWLYFRQHRNREIIRLLESWLQQNENELWVLPFLLDSEYNESIPHDKIEYLETIERTRPGQPSVLLALGYCHWRMGSLEIADRLLRSALDLRPAHVRTRIIVCEFLLERNDVDAAEQVLFSKPSAGDGSDHPGSITHDDRYWDLRCRIEEKRSRHEQAYAFLKKAMKIRPFERRYASRKARLLRMLSRKTEAILAAESAIRLGRIGRELYLLTMKIDNQQPNAEECRRIATLSRQLGKCVQAEGWLRGANTLKLDHGQNRGQ